MLSQWFGPWFGIVGSLLVMLVLMLGVHTWRRVHPGSAELSRKIAHIGLGLLTVSFPWLFDETWPVLVTTGAIVVYLVTLRFSLTLKAHVGGVLDAVARRSLGEIYFPVAVGTLWLLTGGDPLLYCIPLLVLTLADSAAALVGSAYGHWKYVTPEGSRKSAEGSVAFFMVAFFAIHVPLLLFSTAGRAETLLIALILGLLVTLFEAIAWEGLDNLFIPLGGFVLLRDLLDRGTGELTFQLGVLCAVAIIAAVRRRVTTLDDSALMGAVLAAYVIWALEGWQWVLLPVLLFIRGTPLRANVERGDSHFHGLPAVVSVVTPGLLWVMAEQLLNWPVVLLPFALSFGIHASVFELGRLGDRAQALAVPVLSLLCAARGTLLVMVPYVLLAGLSAHTLLQLGLALAVIAIGTAALVVLVDNVRPLPTTVRRWLWQGLLALLGSACGLGFYPA
ncbi:MAG: hypothetical protein U0821_05045 [Chloroflexota bacterium]